VIVRQERQKRAEESMRKVIHAKYPIISSTSASVRRLHWNSDIDDMNMILRIHSVFCVFCGMKDV
jgi:hypothetical protein